MNRVWKSEVVPNRVRKAEFGMEIVALVGHRRATVIQTHTVINLHTDRDAVYTSLRFIHLLLAPN